MHVGQVFVWSTNFSDHVLELANQLLTCLRLIMEDHESLRDFATVKKKRFESTTEPNCALEALLTKIWKACQRRRPAHPPLESDSFFCGIPLGSHRQRSYAASEYLPVRQEPPKLVLSALPLTSLSSY